MKKLLFIFILLALTLSINGQAPKRCTLGVEFAPTIRDLKLGMSLEEVEKILGIGIPLTSEKSLISFQENPDDPYNVKNTTHFVEKDIGIKGYLFNSNKVTNIPPQLEGISGLSLSFFDNSLYVILIRYKPSDVIWKDSKDFANTISEKFSLPIDSWYTSKTTNVPYLFCPGFNISARILENGRPEIYLRDKRISSLVETKESAITVEETTKFREQLRKQKQAFKP